MPYQYQYLDEVRLPFYNPSQSHDPAQAVSGLQPSVGGYYDAYGAGDANAALTNHTLTGIYWGETTYLVDEAGNRFVDEAGNRFIIGNGSTMLRSQITDLRDKLRKRCTLWRYYLDDATMVPTRRDWKTVRFVRMSQPQVQGDMVFKAEISCEFEPLMPHMANWHAETLTTFSTSATAGVAKPFMVENPGETVEDATLKVTCTSGTITTVSIICAELGISLLWTGGIGSGQVLTIDDGRDAVSINGVDSYGGFSRTYHTARSWLRLPQGNYPFAVTLVGGAGTVAMNFYAQNK